MKINFHRDGDDNDENKFRSFIKVANTTINTDKFSPTRQKNICDKNDDIETKCIRMAT